MASEPKPPYVMISLASTGASKVEPFWFEPTRELLVRHFTDYDEKMLKRAPGTVDWRCLALEVTPGLGWSFIMESNSSIIRIPIEPMVFHVVGHIGKRERE